MRDVHHVEHTERDRNADGHRGVKTAEEKPGDDCIQQKTEVHAVLRSRARARVHAENRRGAPSSMALAAWPTLSPRSSRHVSYRRCCARSCPPLRGAPGGYPVAAGAAAGGAVCTEFCRLG